MAMVKLANFRLDVPMRSLTFFHHSDSVPSFLVSSSKEMKSWPQNMKKFLNQIDLFATKYSNLLLSFLLYYHSPLRVYFKYIYQAFFSAAPKKKLKAKKLKNSETQAKTSNSSLYLHFSAFL